MKVLLLSIWLGFFFVCYGFPEFRERIPNGHEIPNPCEQQGGATFWEGVGHDILSGAGARNIFGQDFAKFGFKWNLTGLCRLDSDGDGRLNGEELGDPECQWKEGATPSIIATGHPGVCEPMNSVKCATRNQFIICPL